MDRQESMVLKGMSSVHSVSANGGACRGTNPPLT